MSEVVGRRPASAVRQAVWAALMVGLTLAWSARAGERDNPLHALTIVAGHLYGPGALKDQETPPGLLNSLRLETGPRAGLRGVIALLNNGTAEPNIPGEVFQGTTVDGRLSDGTLINESIDVGYVGLMNGQLKLILAAVGGGPSKGDVHFYLDDDWNWTIFDDIAVDPGFPLGVVKINDFTWSTGPRPLPLSTQTSKGHPGGVDLAGSKQSGEYIPGRLGDDDFDGRLDGMFNAVGSFPLTSVILPGAPFAQTRTFVADIELDAAVAAALTIANGCSHLQAAARGATPADELRAQARGRFDLARRHLERATGDTAAASRRVVRAADEAVSRALVALDGRGAVRPPDCSELRPIVQILLAEGARE